MRSSIVDRIAVVRNSTVISPPFIKNPKSIIRQKGGGNGATFRKDSKETVGRMEGARQNLSSKFTWLKVLAGPKGISSALRAARYPAKYHGEY